MILTLMLVVLTFGAVYPVIRPLLRGASSMRGRAAFDQAVYRDQLRELDRDIARGLLTEAEAKASQLEIQRRLLATTDTATPGATASRSPVLALVILAVTSVGSISLYAVLGEPVRLPTPGVDQRAEIEGLIGRLKERLANEPENQEGWRLYARSTAALGDWAVAIDAYQRAIALGDQSADTTAALGEVLVARAGGTVTQTARDAFAAALTREPGHGMSRYYLALAAGQDGQPREAIQALRDLASEMPADSPVRAEIARQVAALATQAGIEPPALPPGKAAEPGPDQATMEAAANMPAADRAQMVQAMVARLAERLEREPNDTDGWLRLGRAYAVMGEKEKAADAYERAATQRPADIAIPLRAVEALLTGLSITDPLPPRAVAILRRIEINHPDEPAVLWYLGLVAAREGRRDQALSYWRRLRDGLPANHPDAGTVRSAIEALGGE